MSDFSSIAGQFASSTTSFIEKSIEVKFFLILSSLVLLLDSCLVFFYGKNILDALKTVSSPEISIGGALIFMMLFSFLMSFVFLFLRKLLQFLIVLITSQEWFPKGKKEDFGSDLKYLSLAERDALIKKDTFAYSRIQEYKQTEKATETNLTVGFGMSILFFYNYVILGSGSILTISQLASSQLQLDHGFWINRLISIVIGVYVLVSAGFFILALRPTDSDKIFLPDPPKDTAQSIAKNTN